MYFQSFLRHRSLEPKISNANQIITFPRTIIILFAINTYQPMISLIALIIIFHIFNKFNY